MKLTLLLTGLLSFSLNAAPADGTIPSAGTKPFIHYFLPTPPRGELTREAWGATNVLPRDPQNGLEDTTVKQYCYWDGQIIKAPDGKFHMFASRWAESRGHNGWFGSVAGSKVLVIPFDGATLDRDLHASKGSASE